MPQSNHSFQDVLHVNALGIISSYKRWLLYQGIGCVKCGVDLFGPFVVKEGHKELKRYGTLFTCLSSWPIYIEAANSLSTDCFLMCLWRFIDWRGNVRLIRSDSGTNFVGALAELTKAFTEMNHPKINQFMQDKGGEWLSWKRNLPAASNLVDVWDKQIRSARKISESKDRWVIA